MTLSLRAAVAAIAAAYVASVAAQGFVPTRPVELVVHSATGGGSDVFAKAVVEMAEAEKLLVQPLRVVNKTAGASAQAMEYLAQQKGDGHTIAVFTNTWIANPLTRKESTHTVRDFTPIARLVLEPTIAVVRADSPYRTLAEFAAAAKKDPGALKQAGGSATAIESLTGLLIQSATGAKWSFISTPAVRDRMLDLAAGKVDIVIPQPQDANEFIAAGKIRAVAAITEKRLQVLPNLPTVAEQGITMPIIANVRGILGPPGMAPEALRYWEDFFQRLARTPSWKKYVEENQVEEVFMRGGEVAAFLQEQTEVMRKVLRAAGVAVAPEELVVETLAFDVPASRGGARFTGELRLPASGKARLPAVLILHGSAGVDGRGAFHAEALTRAGIATLEIVMFPPGGRPASRRHTMPHAFESLRHLAGDPRIDPDRIGVMGFSWGGAMTLLAASEEVTRELAAPGQRFAAHLAFYPVCWSQHAILSGQDKFYSATTYRRITGRPVHILAGARDDYDDPDSCPRFLGDLSPAVRGGIGLTVYEKGTHGWDGRAGKNFYDRGAYKGRGGWVSTVADPEIARKSRDFAVDYFSQHLR